MRWEQSARYAILSDVGLRRQNNEDSATVRLANDGEEFHRHGHLFLVADGMGGHAVGELASRMAAETIPITYAKSRIGQPHLALRDAIVAANSAIHTKGSVNRDFARMGTTCTALILTEKGAFIGHVGDSRCYRVRRGRIDQLSFDHSLQWELIRRGGMRAEDVFMHEPRNVITRSLGPESSVEVDLEGPFAVLPQDIYVLCSDGLSNHVSDDELGCLASCFAPSDAARQLVNLALARGGSDNVTVVVVAIGDLPAGVPSVPILDPTEPISRVWLGLAWGIAGMVMFGVLLLLMGRYVAGVWICGLSLVTLAGTLFCIWQEWYRRPREKPLHGSETVNWRPYRTASAEPSRRTVEALLKAEGDMLRLAMDEHWPYNSTRHVKRAEAARKALAAGNIRKALIETSEALDIVMKGLLKRRRADAGSDDDLVPEVPKDGASRN